MTYDPQKTIDDFVEQFPLSREELQVILPWLRAALLFAFEEGQEAPKETNQLFT